MAQTFHFPVPELVSARSVRRNSPSAQATVTYNDTPLVASGSVSGSHTQGETIFWMQFIFESLTYILFIPPSQVVKCIQQIFRSICFRWKVSVDKFD